jgi:hypothetical protein
MCIKTSSLLLRLAIYLLLTLLGRQKQGWQAYKNFINEAIIVNYLSAEIVLSEQTITYFSPSNG